MKKTIELVSCEDYVLQEVKEYQSKDTLQGMADVIAEGAVLDRVSKYARLLKQPLTLGMFVPCDSEGELLEEPDDSMNHGISDSSVNDSDMYLYACQCTGYQQALERVIFEGFEIPYPSNEYSTVVRFVGKEFVELNFHSKGIISQFIGATYFSITSISDLTGLGLKIKVK
tara:strand:- start:5558 stop:6070 length:513 start_codon:yes stop_codon:yes gene_type:complete